VQAVLHFLVNKFLVSFTWFCAFWLRLANLGSMSAEQPSKMMMYPMQARRDGPVASIFAFYFLLEIYDREA